jgi:Tfp pilus assembly protein FimV
MFEKKTSQSLAAPLVAAALAVLILLGTAAPSAGAAHPAKVVVRPGETLWAIALRARPGQDPRQEVYAIEQANHLSSATLTAGEVVMVP